MDKTSEKLITDTIKQQYGQQLQGILLFGSQARGDADIDSDVDLGLLLDGKAEPALLWHHAQDIACRICRDVDLIDLRAATTVLQKEAIAASKWLYKADITSCSLFEAHVLSMYQQLQYDRRFIIEDLKQRLKNSEL